DGELEVFALGQLDQLIGLGKLERDRLLEEHVLAGGEEVARHRIVRALWRCGNVDRLEVGLRNQVLVILRRQARAGLPCNSGVLLTASTPRSANFFFTSGSARVFTVSPWNRATMARGVPAGMSTPHQFTATRPGAAAWQVGSSGSSANGSAPVMQSARSLPA